MHGIHYEVSSQLWVQAAIPTTAVPTTAVPTKSESGVEERNQHCGGKVSSKPKGLSRGEVLWSGGKPLPTNQGIGELPKWGQRVVPVVGKAPADMSFIAFWVLQ